MAEKKKGDTLFDILRDYQKEALQKFLENEQGTVVLPTGTGKTLIAVAAIKTLRERGLIDAYVVTVPTIALAVQWEGVLREHGVPASAYLYWEKNVFTSTVFPYPTFIKVSKRFSELAKSRTIESYIKGGEQRVVNPERILLIVDEAHHAHKGRKLYSAVKNFPAKYKLGLTATERSDMALPVIFKLTYEQLKPYIPSVYFKEVMIWPDYEFARKYRSLTNGIIDTLSEMERLVKTRPKNREERKKFEEEFRELEERYTRLLGARFTLISLYNKVLFATVTEVGGLQGKTLVFTMRLEAIREMASFLHTFYKKKVIPVLSKEDADRLRKEEWDIAIAAKRLGEGVDLPEVQNIVLSSYPEELRTLIQEVGRGMRGGPNKTLRIIVMVVRNTYELKAIENLLKFFGILPNEIEDYDTGEAYKGREEIERLLKPTKEEKEEEEQMRKFFSPKRRKK